MSVLINAPPRRTIEVNDTLMPPRLGLGHMVDTGMDPSVLTVISRLLPKKKKG